MATTPYSRGDVVFATPPDINDDKVPITKTKAGSIDKHPVIVLATDAAAHTIKGVIVQTFNGAANLAATPLKEDMYKWFLPVVPATKESIHDPIPTRPDSAKKAEWVNLKDVVTIAEGKIVRSRFFVAAYSSNEYSCPPAEKAPRKCPGDHCHCYRSGN